MDGGDDPWMTLLNWQMANYRVWQAEQITDEEFLDLILAKMDELGLSSP